MKFVLLLFLMMMNSSWADTVKSRVHSIDVSHKKGVPHLVKLENGRVVFIKFEDKEELESFKQSFSNKELLLIDIDENNEEKSVSTLGLEGQTKPPQRRNFSYDPTVVTSSQANNIFSHQRTDNQWDSQCYNRAHVWAYEEYNRSQTKSMKLFLFFTSRYIRNYRYKWWFHVAPMVYQTSGDSTVMTVLDPEFMRAPASVPGWLKQFIYSGRSCPVVSKYSDYSQHQQEQDCYLIPVSMYYWQPRDVENFEKTGYEKTSFVQSEVNYAYWEAF